MITTKFVTYYKKEYAVVINPDGSWFIEGDLTSDNQAYQLPPSDDNIKKALRHMRKWNKVILANAPKCKRCKKDPTQISEYKRHKNPINWVVENERFCETNKFYCTPCYILAGQPRF